MAKVEIPQEQLLRDSEEELERIDAEARRIAGGLSPEQLQWQPPDGGWSAAQVLAHLATANGSYVEPLRRAIDADRASGRPATHTAWTPSFFGGMLIRSMDPANTRRMPSPRIWRPTVVQPAGALDDFLESQRVIRELVRSAHGIDLVRARLSSPVSRFIRVNAGDVIRIFVAHAWRHLGQMRRVIERRVKSERVKSEE